MTKKYTKRGVEKTRCSQTMTEAAFFSWILSHLRRLTMKWKPKNEALTTARRPYKGPNKRQKWEYKCARCKKWFARKEVDIDHIIPMGGMTTFEKAGEWLRKALCEVDGFQVLCKEDHQLKTKKEKGVKK